MNEKVTNDIIIKNCDSIMYPDNILVKANQLITGKYKASPVEQKIFNYALTKVKYNEKEQRPIAVIEDNDLKDFLDIKHHDFNNQIDGVALSLQSNTFLLKDIDTNDFLSIMLIPVAEHIDGVLKLYYEPKATKFILNLKSNFTKINLDVYKNLQTIYAMRLYEIFKSQLYRAESFVFHYNILDLKFDIGMIETNSKANNAICKKGMTIQEILDNKYIDEKKVLYKDTWSFTNVIGNAIREINDVTDIWVDYDLIKKGRGGKLTSVKFIVTSKNNIKRLEEGGKPTDDELLDMMMTLKTSITHEFTVSEYRHLLETANYQVEKVLSNYELAKDNDEITDIYAWLLKAIKDNYHEKTQERKERLKSNEPNEKKKSKKKPKNNFHNFSQREYSDEELNELEKKLLSK